MWLWGTTNVLSRGSEKSPQGPHQAQLQEQRQPAPRLHLLGQLRGWRTSACLQGPTSCQLTGPHPWWMQGRETRSDTHTDAVTKQCRQVAAFTALQRPAPICGFDYLPLDKPQMPPPLGDCQLFPSGLAWLSSPLSSCLSLRPLQVFPTGHLAHPSPQPTGLPLHSVRGLAPPGSLPDTLSFKHDTPSLSLAIGIVVALLRRKVGFHK